MRSIFTLACLYALAAAPAMALSPHPGEDGQDHGHDEDHAHGHGQIEQIVVRATRTGRTVQDEPIRVEVINREEIEEKLLMTPGHIATLLAETGGLRVQVTSPALGAANIRVQGMKGRYTQLLADGLPLYGGQASSIGLLQIPPTDLGQVEVIKGTASALYGPSALGGVINLVSRRPGDAFEHEYLFNVTSQDGQDLTAYAAAPISEAWSYSLTGGAHWQSLQDLSGEGWADIPEHERFTLRPRLFWDGQGGATAYMTAGVMTEQRAGGTTPGAAAPDGRPFRLAQDSTRMDAGMSAEIPLAAGGTLHARASAMRQTHDHVFGDVRERDRHDTAFAEAAYGGGQGRLSWMAGAALQADAYRSDDFAQFDYTFTTPGVFAQAELDLDEALTLSGSVRWDQHSEYGGRFSPRLSALYRPGAWTFRASVGQGFFAPAPFVEEIEAAGLSRLEPLSGLRAETAETASLDAGRMIGPFEASATLFASNLNGAVRLEPAGAGADGEPRVRLVNADGATRTRGTELSLRYRWQEITVTGSYVYVDATEPAPSGTGRRAVPLTPRHSAGFVAMWEDHDRGRIGFEAYYSGRQQLEDNPYRSLSRPYVEMGVLGELIFGNVSVFLNAENILNVRQSRHDPMLLPARAADGRWTVDSWAPADGFIVNGGIRLKFGGRPQTHRRVRAR